MARQLQYDQSGGEDCGKRSNRLHITNVAWGAEYPVLQATVNQGCPPKSQGEQRPVNCPKLRCPC